MLKIVDDRVSLIQGDLIEPLNMYIQHHETTSQDQFERAIEILHNLHEKQIKHDECHRSYFTLCSESEHNEIAIEKVLLTQQQGEVDEEKVKEVMDKSLNTKFKSQTAEKNYKESIEEINQAFDLIENEYKPILQ